MAVGKWIHRDLATGILRDLTLYEVKYGNIHISNGKTLRSLVDVNEVEIAGTVFAGRRINTCGRVSVPPTLLKSLRSRKVRINLAGTRIRVGILEAETL